MGWFGYNVADTSRRIRQKYFQKFVFIHINKTGGSSIEKALSIQHEHKTASEKQKEYGDYLWGKKHRFTFVRNPWDKVVSHYHFRKMTNQTNLRDENIDFNTWVKLAYQDHHPKYYDKPKMFMQQYNWICDEQGNDMMDFIGRFENLSDDFDKVCVNLNIKGIALPHLKKSKRGTFRGYYNDESVAIIANCFDKDIEYFKYNFE